MSAHISFILVHFGVSVSLNLKVLCVSIALFSAVFVLFRPALYSSALTER